MYKDGQGCWVTDLEDNKFLDMMGGFGIKAQVMANKKLQILPINNYPNFLLLLLILLLRQL